MGSKTDSLFRSPRLSRYFKRKKEGVDDMPWVEPEPKLIVEQKPGSTSSAPLTQNCCWLSYFYFLNGVVIIYQND